MLQSYQSLAGLSKKANFLPNIQFSTVHMLYLFLLQCEYPFYPLQCCPFLEKMLYLTWQTRMESQVTIFWEWLQLFPCLMIDCTSDISRKHITMWMIISKRFTKPMRLCGYVGEIGDAYAQLDGRPTILTQSFLFNCFLAKLGLVHRMAVPYVYWSVPRSWVQLTQYNQVLTSTAPYWPSTTKYQPVSPSTDPVL